jgi:hypothetical protein
MVPMALAVDVFAEDANVQVKSAARRKPCCCAWRIDFQVSRITSLGEVIVRLQTRNRT